MSGAQSASGAPGAGAQILRLPDEVVNRIAAGEVVVSPAAALKELLENSIDAGARAVTVAVRGGGAKLLQVTDDGRGVAPADLPLLCERHATSKLRTFDDLADVATFGFRGEALASVSHVARVSVRSKTSGAKCAMAARYLDGALVDAPAPTAGIDGTVLSVEDLFYNLPTRRRALRPAADEYRAIVDVVARYAIKYCGVAFVCKRLPDAVGARGRSATPSGPDVRTPADSSVVANIRAAFGANIASELVAVDVSLEQHGVTATAYASKAGFSMRKNVFIIFINGRLVNCGPLKRAVEAAYSAYLPKGGHPFMYIDVAMRPRDVDVNVHPNKMEVRFLHESELIDALVSSLDTRLKSDGRSRTFLAQALISDDGTLCRPSTAAKEAPSLKRGESEMTGADVDKPFSPEQPRVQKKRRHGITGSKVGPLIDREAAGIGGGHEEGESGADDADEGDAAFINDGEAASDTASSSSSLHLDTLGSASGPVDVPPVDESVGDGEVSKTPLGGTVPSTYPKSVMPRDMVRTGRGAQSGALDAFMTHGDGPSVALELRKRRQRRSDALPILTSISETIDGLRASAHPALSEIVKSHSFVGVVSERYALVQHQTKLILVDIVPVISELMFRQTLMRFADLDTVELKPAASLLEIVALGVEDADTAADTQRTVSHSDNDTPPRRAVQCVELLLEKAPLLDEYFALGISGSTAQDAKLTAIPLLFAGIWPDLSLLPEFCLSLLDVDWTAEQPCLVGIARALSAWYSDGWLPNDGSFREDLPDGSATGKRKEVSGGDGPSQSLSERKEWLMRHVLFESLRFDFDPPSHLAPAFREITSTRKLYRIFERC